MPWWAQAAITILALVGGALGSYVALRNVLRKERADHDDAECRRLKRSFEADYRGTLIVDRELRILVANKQARAISGYYSDLVGRSVYDLIDQRFHDAHRKHVEHFFDDPHIRRMGTLNMQTPLRDRTGREKPMRISLTPHEDDYGSVEVTVGMKVLQEM